MFIKLTKLEYSYSEKDFEENGPVYINTDNVLYIIPCITGGKEVGSKIFFNTTIGSEMFDPECITVQETCGRLEKHLSTTHD